MSPCVMDEDKWDSIRNVNFKEILARLDSEGNDSWNRERERLRKKVASENHLKRIEVKGKDI